MYVVWRERLVIFIDKAYKHFILAAKAGFKDSLDKTKQAFMTGYVTKDEFASTLRAYQQRHDEMKSEDRDNVKMGENTQ